MQDNKFAISPLDGRYQDILNNLKNIVSEYSLYRYRIIIEIEFLKTLLNKKIIPQIPQIQINSLDKIISDYSLKEYKKIKKIEQKIKHDIKACEYYLRKKLTDLKIAGLIPYIHFGLTSDDVNNLAYSLILNESNKKIIIPLLLEIQVVLKKLAIEFKSSELLARTHGQPAVPTTFGKEIANYYVRLSSQIKKIIKHKFEGKLNGAVGCYNGLILVYPEIDWISFSNAFITSLGLKPNLFTTQILPYDNYIEFFQSVFLINCIFINLCQDIWTYIMLGELDFKKEAHQIGSSTMPQKINPIDFENAEGNLQIANSYFELYSRKLSVSRLQRDLSDSTVKRTFGTSIGHTVIAWKNLKKGLSKIAIDRKETEKNLDEHWEVLMEALQLYLRSKGDQLGYEKTKKYTQGKKITKQDFTNLVIKLGLVNDKKISDLNPKKYIGMASKIISLLNQYD